MNHGTYHEAIQAGFTTEQAAFFARAYCETKNEAWQRIEERLLEERARPMAIISATWKQWALLVAVWVGGFFAGMAV